MGKTLTTVVLGTLLALMVRPFVARMGLPV
jgi:hypothetical protein